MKLRNHRISRLLLSVAAAALLSIMVPGALRADTTVVSDPFSGSGGDLLSRGFYVTSYDGTNLGSVTLEYNSDKAGVYVTSLTANLGAYNGPIIGSPETITTTLGLTSTETLVTYNFGGVSVPFGSLITFTQQQISGPEDAFFNVGLCSFDPSCALGTPGVVETDGTTAPLDIFRRGSVGVVITETNTPEPSVLLLMSTGLIGLVVLRSYRMSHSRPGLL